MVILILILVAIALIDFEAFLSLFRFAAFFVLGVLLSMYAAGCALQWLVS